MSAIVVIADDLSGAAELAGIAARHGLSAEVQTAFTAATDTEVICVDTDTRSLSAERAAREAGAVAQRIVAGKPAWIFKKCDSVLRGSVLAESRAIASAAEKSRIVVVSANPARGRVVRGGNYFVEEQPLHETVFARDPAHPRTTSLVAELLGADLAGVLAPDAVSTADVVRHAATTDDDTLPVGGADFFQALLETRVPQRARSPSPEPFAEPVGATLVVCGSAASWPQRRAEAIALGVASFAMPHDVAAAIRETRSSARVLIGIGDGPKTHGLSSDALVTVLARSVAEILRETNIGRMLLEGGATAAAVMRAMGWTRLRAVEASAQGVGVLRPLAANGPMLFIKPGSYLWPQAVWPGNKIR